MPQAMLIMTAISAVASYAQGQQVAAAQNRAANEQSKAAWENHYAQLTQLKTEAEQQNNQAMVEKSERAKQLLAEQGKISTIAGESGISGNSVSAFLDDSYMQAGIDMTTSETNRLSRAQQGAGQSQSSYAQAKRANSQANAMAQDGYNKAPSLLGTALKIGSAGAGYINDYGSLTSTTRVKK